MKSRTAHQVHHEETRARQRRAHCSPPFPFQSWKRGDIEPGSPPPSVPPTWGQKRANPNPAVTRSAWSPANKWWLFASSLFVKTLGSCLSSRIRSRVMNPRSLYRQACLAFFSSFPRTESCTRQSGSTCARTIVNCCVFGGTVMDWSWSTPKPMQ